MSDTKLRKTSQALKQFQLYELKAIVRYLHIQNEGPSEIHKLISAACGEGAPSYKVVREWIQIFEENQEDPSLVANVATGVKNGPMNDAPTDPALVARIESLIQADRRISVERIADMSLVSVHTAQGLISNVLGLKRICERWVPRLWTPEQRAFRVAVCHELQEMFRDQGESLRKVICGGEAFAIYYLPEQISASKTERKTSQVAGDKYKKSADVTIAYCYTFFDSQGMIAAELTESSSPPDSEEYLNIIKNSVIPALKRKRGSADNYFLLHDTTPVHNSAVVQNGLLNESIKSLPHAPASPDLEPLEYWLHRHFFRHMEDHSFKSRADIWSAMQRNMHSLTDLEYNNAVQRLVERWNICIEKNGLYLL